MTHASVKLLSPGLCTLVVDHGRPRTRSLGVPVGGAADCFALAIGNALVGNPPDAPALEVALLGPTLLSDASLACVLYGAPFALHVEGQQRSPGWTFTLQPGEKLQIGGTAILACPSRTIASRTIPPIQDEDYRTLHVLAGGQANWFAPQVLPGRAFQVTPASNRMGLRLSGEPLPVPAREMVSEPVCPGQFTWRNASSRSGCGWLCGLCCMGRRSPRSPPRPDRTPGRFIKLVRFRRRHCRGRCRCHRPSHS